VTGTPQEFLEEPGRHRPGAARLTLLGNFVLHADGGPVAIPTKKNRALLAILALSPNGQATRERLCGLLWGERGEEQARSSLRQALAVLRRELGPGNGILKTRDDVVALHLPDLDIDVLQFDRWSRGEVEQLRGAAALLQGELLADTSLHEEGFDEWLAGERRKLSERAIAVLDGLAARERGPAQIGYARRLVEIDPLREASHRALIRAYHLAGETALAIKQYELCCDILKRELGVDPAPQTQQLRRSLAARPEPRRQAAAPAVGEASPTRPAEGGPETEAPSIAVLPFHNLSGDAEQQYFSDGLTEDLTTDLTKVPGLKVIAAHSALQIRGDGVDPAEAARALKVRYIVQGSVRQVPGSIRVNAKLIDAANGVVKWADRYDRRLEDIHDIQTEIARQIAGVFTGPVPLPGERYRPKSLEAFDLVMRGRKEWRNSDETGARAAPLFERAVALDPNYGEAYRWLACGQALSWLHFGAAEEPNRRLSMINARKAVECDQGDAAAHAILAFILMYERQWDAASAEFEIALKLNPNDGDAWSNLSDLRVMEGRGREAVHCAERALDRNPRPLGSFFWLLGQAQIAAGDLEDAVTTLRREETYATGSRRFLAAALALQGRIDEAHDEARLFMAANPHFSIRHWAETQPFRDLAMRDYFIEAYRKAGLPD